MNDSFPTRIGFLGGGQLARMLVEPAHRLGLTAVVFAESVTSPAALVTPATVVGTLQDEVRLRSFFEQVDVVAFENEFVDTELLANASAGTGCSFVPSLETIRTLQDKLGQKRLLHAAQVPTSPFIEPEPDESDEAFASRAETAFPAGVVFKWSRMGYDGHGVMLTRPGTIDRPALSSFIAKSRERGGVTFAEARIDFVRELAMVCTASAGGEFAFYPLVVTEQEHGICRHVYGPATLFGVAPALEAAARDACRRVAAAANLAGTFALEFFESQDGKLLVNEIAPRVHNTGHYSQNACSASQFENHVRAVAGLPLHQPVTAPAFAMLNVLGPEGVDRDVENDRPPASGPSTHVHWYCKDRLKARRKLGHINAVADSVEALEAAIREMRAIDTAWCASVRKNSRSRS